MIWMRGPVFGLNTQCTGEYPEAPDMGVYRNPTRISPVPHALKEVSVAGAARGLCNSAPVGPSAGFRD